MQCKQCNKGTCILITQQNNTRTRERRGFLVWLITLPIRIFRWLFRFGVQSQHQDYGATTVWRCNYCGQTTPQEFPEQSMAQSTELVKNPEQEPQL
ncbi:MAG: hypothetical protein FWE16_03720 [Firmicutes bacterium]|nr:hypothetical protein [Bacillota bacterium]